jgi:SecD/SecF fusion protein
MKSNLLWKFLLVVFVVAYAVNEGWPPTSRPLLTVFEERAQNKDEAFKAIVTQATAMQGTNSVREFGNLFDSVGTNSLVKYFPTIPTEGESNPNRAILQRLQKDAAGKIRLGLDLQGGTMFVVGVDTSSNTNATDVVQKEHLLSQAVEILRKRVDKFGVAEPVILPQGDDRIVIQLPGLSQSDLDSARRQIEQAAVLHFRMVHPQSAQLVNEDVPEPGYEFMVEKDKDPATGKTVERKYLVSRKPERGLTGKYLEGAYATRDVTTGKPTIAFTFNDEGALLFGEVTEANVGNQLAIVLDGELQSAPVIEEKITKSGIIRGNYTLKEAIELANVLQNPLETPVKVLEERTVDPSLGKDSISSGFNASLYGTIAVGVFMAVFYFFGGMVANFALLLNVIITLGIMCSIDATLTLPGIAGLVLSIGMAVDANVLIFERIREELAAGKSLRGALAAGYDRAFGTIFDSHVTTLISAIILIKMGTGPIKGFGVTLTIGVAASLFTALVVTRLVFDFLIERGMMKSLPMLPVVKLTKVDFIGLTKPAFALSLLLILGGLGYGVFGRGHKMLGVDFAGGDSLTLSFTQKVEDVDKLRDAVEKAGVGEATIQYQKPLSGGSETLSVTTALGTAERVEQALAASFPESKFTKVGFDQVGPTVGREIQASAIKATFLAMLGILVYVAFRYEFSFAVAAVVATMHDALITMALFALSGGHLSATIVAAFLTILGYSINDKIVILDRIREDLQLGVRGSFREIINLALNQTLSRTIITGGSVLLATLSLFIFGGGVIHDFAFCFLVGVVAGTYSSIFIASAIVLWWHKGRRPNIGGPTGGAVVVEETPVAAAKA